MISKMKFISLVGPRSEFDRIASDYVLDSAIEFENPLHALRSTGGFTMDTSPNPYENSMKHVADVLEYVHIDCSGVRRHDEPISKEELDLFLCTLSTAWTCLKCSTRSLR